MRVLLSKLLTLIKREPYQLDKDISLFYLSRFLFEKTFMFFYGAITYTAEKKGILFRSKSSTLKAKNKIFIEGNVLINKDVYIDALSRNGVHLGKGVSLGRNVSIECTGSLKDIGEGLTLGENVGIGSFSFLGCAGGITIGKDSILGNYVSIHSENHNYTDLATPIRLQGVNRKGISIADNCWIGAKVTILDGAIIESGCIIAANSLVPKGKYIANNIYGGVPAKLIKHR